MKRRREERGGRQKGEADRGRQMWENKGNVREQRQMWEDRDRCERTGADVRELG